jgi:ATP-dependent DNA helicase PIF1
MSWAGDYSDPPPPSSSPLPFYYDPPLPQAPRQPAQNCIGLQRQSDNVEFTPYAPLPQIRLNSKRTSTYIDLTGEDENEYPTAKRAKLEPVDFAAEKYELSRLEQKVAPAPVEEKPVELSEEQQRVVHLAMKRKNIFLTGAAGSGKTTVLREIMRKLRMKKRGGKVQVVVPTGIAALPLGGKTTFSFAGVSICSTCRSSNSGQLFRPSLSWKRT